MIATTHPPKIGFYLSAREPEQYDTTTLEDIIDAIKSDEFAAKIAKLRSTLAAGDDDGYAAAKKDLPAVSISGAVKDNGLRAKAMEEGRFTHSGFLQLDFDAADNIGWEVHEIVEMLAADSRIVAAFVSPSGHGVKGIARIAGCKTKAEHAACFAASRNVWKERNLIIDEACKDPVRLMFVSHDPDAWIDLTRTDVFEPAIDSQDTPQPPAKAKVNTDNHQRLVLRSPAFPEPPTSGIHTWLMEAAWHCRLNDSMTEADTVAKLESYDGRLRRALQPTEAVDAARAVFSTALESKGEGPVSAAKTVSKLDAEELRARAYAMRFDPNEVPPPDETCMVIGDVPIAARGNLTVPQGKSKVGKSALISAIIGAAHRGNHYAKGDTLCVEWQGDSTGAIIHMDTEQSRADWHALVCRGITRSGLPETSPRLVSLPLVMFSRSERLAILKQTLAFELDEKGMIDLVLIDGVADLCVSPNDEAEALELVSQLHALAQEFNCPIVCVLHENPGTDQGKTRGHLGSELNRKAFANLRIDKDTETSVSTIYGTDMRKRDIPKEQGFCFAWDEATKMHTFQGRSAGLKAAQAEAKATTTAWKEWGKIFEKAAEIGTNLTCPGLAPKQAAEIERDMIGTKELTKEATMKKRMQRAETLGVLRKSPDGGWTLNPIGTIGT